MKTEKIAAKKGKVHIQYRNAANVRVPGVSGITGVMAKPYLLPWANKLGLQGIDVKDYVDALADIGTLGHTMITNHIMELDTDFSQEYSKEQIDVASNCVIKWHYWADKHVIEPIRIEQPTISEKYQYGGTPDIYCRLDGKLTLIDIKTAKAIYGDMFTQCAGYKLLLEEIGCHVEQIFIVRVGRSDDEGVEAEVKECGSIEDNVERFLACLKLYRINQKINKE